MSVELKGLYTPKQAALLLGIHPKTIFRWLREEGGVNTVIVAGQRLIPESEVERLRGMIDKGELCSRRPGNQNSKASVISRSNKPATG